MVRTTPDSVPSLAEASTESADDGVDEITRVLFDSPQSVKDKTVEVVHVDGGKYFVGCDDNSIATNASDDSEGTLGISASPNMEVVQAALEGITNSPETPMPKPSKICHGVFAPRDFADMFTMFSGAQKNWPPPPPPPPPPVERTHMPSTPVSIADSGVITAVASNLEANTISWERKIDSLERECNTLKDIIKADSIKILKLKSELENVRAQQSSPEQNPLQSGLESLQKERDVLRERDCQHIETVRILKEEVSTLSQLNYDASWTQKELQQLRLENELFASQIIDSEAEIRKLNKTISGTEKQCQKENEMRDSPPRTPREERGSYGKESTRGVQKAIISEVESLGKDLILEEYDDSDEISLTPTSPILEQIAVLTARLDALELERKAPKTRQELPIVEDVGCSPQGDGIEVTVEGKVIGDKAANDRQKDKRTSGWHGLCDCFLQSHILEDE